MNRFSIRKVSCFIEKSPKIPWGNGIFWGRVEIKIVVTGTLVSNLTCLATLRQVSMGVELFIWDPRHAPQICPQQKTYSGYV